MVKVGTGKIEIGIVEPEIIDAFQIVFHFLFIEMITQMKLCPIIGEPFIGKRKSAIFNLIENAIGKGLFLIFQVEKRK